MRFESLPLDTLKVKSDVLNFAKQEHVSAITLRCPRKTP